MKPEMNRYKSTKVQKVQEYKGTRVQGYESLKVLEATACACAKQMTEYAEEAAACAV